MSAQQLRQILPVVVGSLLAVSFGTMLGWPSTVYPFLINIETAPIVLSWDQSAILAGYLMAGNILGGICTVVKVLGSKTAIVLSLVCQISGCFVLYYTNDVYGIGLARALVGFGNGFGSEQLKTYAQESCEPKVFDKIMKYLPLSLNVGIVLVYTAGTMLSFRNLSLFCASVPIVALLIFIPIPKKVVHHHCDHNHFQIVETIYHTKEYKSQKKSEIFAIFKSRENIKNFFILSFLICVPQYTGGASNIIYSQVIYRAGRAPYPEYCSIAYGFMFLFSNIIAITYIKLHKKSIIIVSSIICCIVLSLYSFYFYFLNNLLIISDLFTWLPLSLSLFYNFFHTIGINVIPMLFIKAKFTNKAKTAASKFYLIYFCLSGLISTKLFQVFYTGYGMYAVHSFFTSVCFVNIFLIIYVLRSYRSKPKLDSFVYQVSIKNNISNNNEICPEVNVYV